MWVWRGYDLWVVETGPMCWRFWTPTLGVRSRFSAINDKNGEWNQFMLWSSFLYFESTLVRGYVFRAEVGRKWQIRTEQSQHSLHER